MKITTVIPGEAFTMSDADAERALATARALDQAGALTRPSGERRFADSSAGAEGWTGRQAIAARELAKAWRQGIPAAALPCGYRAVAGVSGGVMTADQEKAAGEAWRRYSEGMAEVTRRLGHRHAGAVRMNIIDQQPMALWAVPIVREALEVLAEWWGIR